jgi:hypothetical protein
MDKLVDSAVRNCIPCQAATNTSVSAPLQMTEMPTAPWYSIAVDFCGPLPSNEYLLVVTDEYSRYPVVELVSSTSASVVIPRMEKIFGLFSLPRVIKSDNGPPFQSKAWSDFVQSIGCTHRKITPLWPQANGQVEAFNKPLMKAVRTAHSQGLIWKRELHKFLQSYRFTPHTSTKFSPFKLLFGRDPVTKLPELPQTVSDSDTDNQARTNDFITKTKAKEYADSTRKPSISLVVGDHVLVRQTYSNKLSTPFNPTPHIVVAIKGTMITAQSPDGRKITRNISHFKRVQVSNSDFDNVDFDEVDYHEPDNHDRNMQQDQERNAQHERNVQVVPRRSERDRNRPRRLIEEI